MVKNSVNSEHFSDSGKVGKNAYTEELNLQDGNIMEMNSR